MTTRRGARPTQVRPRPPSSGRPDPIKARPRAPLPGRIATHRPIQRRGSLPLGVKVALALAVLVLGAGVLVVGAGGLRLVATGLGSTLAGFVEGVTSTPTPSATVTPISDAPSLAAPSEPYTSSPRIDLQVTVPAALIGSTDHHIRVYLALKDQPLTPIQDAAISDSAKTIVPVALEVGINDLSVSIVGPEGESDTSPVVRYVLDTTKPKISITAPKDGAVVNGNKVTVSGKVQGRSQLIARNTDNGSSASGTAASDGTFSLSIALATGLNHVTINATDPAGNAGSISFTVRRGTGRLTVSLSSSASSVSRRGLPARLRLSCVVTDPDGHALAGADVTFTLSVPGLPTITQDGKTGVDGRYSFQTTINRGADLGQGNATVLVSSTDYGSTQDLVSITMVK